MIKLRAVTYLALSVPASAGCDFGSGPSEASRRPIVFAALSPGGFTSDLWAIATDGGDTVNLTNSPNAADATPAVSRNGRVIAFASDGPPAGMHKIEADGTGRVPLPANDQFNWYPAWSADGSRIAFESLATDGRPEIWVMNSDASEARLVVAPGRWPTWSADGTRIAYEGEDCQIWVVGTDGSNPHPLRAGGCSSDTLQYQPAWSPDGSRIATSSDVPLVPGARARLIITMLPDATQARAVSDGPSDTAPAWSPDGRHLVYVHGGQPEAGLSLLIVAAGGERTGSVTTGWPLITRPSW